MNAAIARFEQVCFLLGEGLEIIYSNLDLSTNPEFRNVNNLKQIFSETFSELLEEDFARAMEGETAKRKRSLLLDGKEFWYECVLTRLNSSTKQQAFLTIQNITNTFHAEKNIDTDRLTNILSLSPNMIICVKRDLTISYINHSLNEILTKENVLHKEISYIFDESDFQKVKPFLEQAFAGNDRIQFEMQSSTYEDRWFIIQINILKKNYIEEVEEIVATATDISQKVRSFQQLKESEFQFRQLADNAPIMIWISGVDGLCIFLNKSWLRFRGRKFEEELGNGWTKGIHPDDIDFAIKTYRDNFYARKDFAMECRFQRGDSTYAWVLVHGVPYYNPNKEFWGYLGTCLDISLHRESERKMKTALEEKEILIREIHHRVKNNLQIISSLLSLQRAELQDEKAIRALEDSMNRIKSIGLLHDMLNLSRAEGVIDLGEYIRSLTQHHRTIQKNSRNEIKFKISSQNFTISIDKAIYIGLIINELILNSVKYAFEEQAGEIQIGACLETGKFLIVTYQDSGKGFLNENPKLVSSSWGLKLVQMLVLQLGGQMESVLDQNTKYIITIPWREENT